jgi:hypothetical protein
MPDDPNLARADGRRLSLRTRRGAGWMAALAVLAILILGSILLTYTEAPTTAANHVSPAQNDAASTSGSGQSAPHPSGPGTRTNLVR